MTAPRRVFITGALGFIGRATAREFGRAGCEVIGVDLRADAGAGVVPGDTSRPGPWQRHLAGCDLVVHTAAVVSNAVGADEQWRVNVLGTRRVLDAARDAGVDRLIHLSSIRAFSDTAFPDGVDEQWPVRTDGNPYVDTKVASEQVVLQAHAAGEVSCTVVRPGDVYGPGSRPWTVIPVQMLRAGTFALPAMGRGIFSPVYVEDLTGALLLMATTEAAAGRVITITGGVGVPTAEFFGHYARMLGCRPPRLVPTSVALAAAGVFAGTARLRGRATENNPATVRYLARNGTYSIELARTLLGYTPRVDLEEGMRRTEAWLRAEGMLG